MTNIGNNLLARLVGRNLEEATSDVRDSTERLAAGLRVTDPSEDPAALALSTKLSTDSRIFTKALSNVSNGISLISIAENALDSLADINDQQLELIERAGDTTLTPDELKKINDEANALVGEYNRIVSTAEYNGKRLFADGGSLVQIQSAKGSSESVTFITGEELERTSASGEFGTATTYSTDNSTQYATTADLNNDGYLDLIDTTVTASHVGIRLGNGDGTFGARTTLVAGANPTFVVTDDLNTDGNLDLIVTDNDGDSASIFLGNGDGTFGARTSYAGAAGVNEVDLADVDGDGNQDLLIVSSSTDSVGIRFGNGDGTFDARVDYAAGDQALEVEALDVDSDGDLDLAVTDVGPETISILINNGDGTFQAPTTLAASTDPSALEAADLNGDGYTDLVSTSAPTDKINVFLGNGDGTFQTRLDYTTGDAPISLNIKDISGDGILDVVTGDVTGNTISILKGNGDGTFQTKSSLASGSSPQNIELADLNGDNVLDLLVANFSSNNVGVYLGTTTRVSNMPYLNLYTEAGRASALETVSDTLDRVTTEQGATKGSSTKLDIAYGNLLAVRDTLNDAVGQILNVNVAEEKAHLLKSKVIQNSATSLFAQANLEPQIVLTLLKE